MLLDYAKSELAIAGIKNNDTILKIVELFCTDGHSGVSAECAIEIITRLLSYKPLTPLTGDASEWNEISKDLYQSKRSLYIFKENGRAYHVDNKDIEITFPYWIK